MSERFEKGIAGLLDDPKLPHLRSVLNMSVMAERFEQHLHACGLDPEWKVTRCAIEKIYYRPKKRCRVLYRLTFSHTFHGEEEEWFYGEMAPSGRGEIQFNEATATAKPHRAVSNFLGELPPVSLWRELNMVLWMFPQDPNLAMLPQVVDPSFMKKQVEANWKVFFVPTTSFDPEPFDFAQGKLHRRTQDEEKTLHGERSRTMNWRCINISYERMKYMPGKRCVLRCRVNLGERDVTFYSKIYKNAMGRYHFNFLKSACEQLKSRAVPVNIPCPLCFLDGYNTVWQEDWGGRPLIDAFNQRDAGELFPRIAAMLVEFQNSQITGLRPGPDIDTVLLTATQDGTRFANTLPQHQDLVNRVIVQLNKSRPVLQRQPIPSVPSHGACRLEQMLIKGSELALLDFDALASGDPLYDVAEFMASLQFLEFTHGLPREQLSKAAESFYESYAAQMSLSCDPRRLAWYALAFLLTKMDLAVKSLDIPALERLESNAETVVNEWLSFIS